MKLKLLAAITFLSVLPGIATAFADASLFDASVNAPYYIYIGWNNNSFVNPPTEFSGTIKITNGKFTLGKEILINSDEKLTSNSKDLGTLSSEIDFDTKVRLTKGVILRVFPDQGKSATISVEVTKSLNGNTDSVNSDLIVNENADTAESRLVVSAAQSFYLQILSANFNHNLTLDQRNQAFSGKLEMLKKVISIVSWAEEKFIKGDLSENNLLLARDTMIQIIGHNNYSSGQAGDFLFKINRFIFRFNKGELPTDWMIYGLERFAYQATL